MRRKDLTFNLDDYKIIEELNYDRTVMIAEEIKTSKKYVMKSIDVANFKPQDH